MGLDVQKGNIWKRISALLLDIIVVSIAAVLFAVLFSLIFGYDGKLEAYEEIRTSIEEQYGISFPTTEQEYNAFDEEMKARYDAASGDERAADAMRLSMLLINLEVLIVTFSLLLAILIFEFVLPLILKHGRTLGKRVFGLAVMRNNFVKASGPVMFIRAILGKYAIETMIPAFILINIFFFGKVDILMLILLVLVPIVNLVLIIATKNNCPIHDLIAMTVVVDFDSQKIFDTEAEMIAYKTAKHEEAVREGTAAYHDFQK